MQWVRNGSRLVLNAVGTEWVTRGLPRMVLKSINITGEGNRARRMLTLLPVTTTYYTTCSYSLKVGTENVAC